MVSRNENGGEKRDAVSVVKLCLASQKYSNEIHLQKYLQKYSQKTKSIYNGEHNSSRAAAIAPSSYGGSLKKINKKRKNTS